MDFDLSDDQLALRDGARELLDRLSSPERVRAHTTTDENAQSRGNMGMARSEGDERAQQQNVPGLIRASASCAEPSARLQGLRSAGARSAPTSAIE